MCILFYPKNLWKIKENAAVCLFVHPLWNKSSGGGGGYVKYVCAIDDLHLRLMDAFPPPTFSQTVCLDSHNYTTVFEGSVS